MVVGLWLHTLVVGVCFVMLSTGDVSELEKGEGRENMLEFINGRYFVSLDFFYFFEHTLMLP